MENLCYLTDVIVKFMSAIPEGHCIVFEPRVGPTRGQRVMFDTRNRNIIHGTLVFLQARGWDMAMLRNTFETVPPPPDREWTPTDEAPVVSEVN